METYNDNMVIGYSVLQPTANNPGKVGAIAAKVSNENDLFWALEVERYDEEFGAGLSNNVEMAIEEFKRRNGTFPKTIFFYRSDIGHDLMQYQEEVKDLKTLVQNYGENMKLVFIG